VKDPRPFVLSWLVPALDPGGFMRTAFLLPLAAVVAVVAGCDSQGSERAARSVPRRDLTLVEPAHAVGIASPVELQNLRTNYRSARPSQRATRRSRPAEPTVMLAAVAAAPAPVVAVPGSAAQPATTPESANSRELLPGKTVTLIPASSGPSSGSDWTDELPRAKGATMGVGGGGRCPRRGRGPGIGIAGIPRPDFR
jgi:hypothetical protein